METTKPILVVGGTGTTGRRVASRLKDQGYNVRIGARGAPVPFDWEQRSTWPGALDGVERVYLAHPDMTSSDAAQQISAFARLAVESGARRLVVLTGRDNPILAGIEAAIVSSSADWTLLRPAWFNQNFSEGFLRPMVMGGEIALPVGEGKEAFIDADDIAEVAVASLLNPQHIGRALELSGPRLLSFADVADIISATTGHAVRYTAVPQPEFRQMLREHGMPESLADGYAEIESSKNATVTHDIEDVLGRKARDFVEFAAQAHAAKAWK